MTPTVAFFDAVPLVVNGTPVSPESGRVVRADCAGELQVELTFTLYEAEARKVIDTLFGANSQVKLRDTRGNVIAREVGRRKFSL